MNERFVRAHTIYERKTEETIARQSECNGRFSLVCPQPANVGTLIAYEKQRPAFSQHQSVMANPRISATDVARQLQTQPRPQVQHPSQHVQQAPQPQPQTAYVKPYPAQDNSRASKNPKAQPQLEKAGAPRRPKRTKIPSRPQIQSQPHSRPAQSQSLIQTQPRTQTQKVVQQQSQAQAQISHSSVETHALAQPPPRTQVQKQQTSAGPPIVLNKTTTYQDTSGQVWAECYNEDGSVCSISVPGTTGTNAHTSPTVAVRRPGAEGQRRKQQQATSAMSFSGSAAKTPPPGQFVNLPRCTWTSPVSARDDRGGRIKVMDDYLYFKPPGIQPYKATTRVFTEVGGCLSLRM